MLGAGKRRRGGRGGEGPGPPSTHLRETCGQQVRPSSGHHRPFGHQERSGLTPSSSAAGTFTACCFLSHHSTMAAVEQTCTDIYVLLKKKK